MTKKILKGVITSAKNNKTVVTASSTCVIADMPRINFKKMIGDTNAK